MYNLGSKRVQILLATGRPAEAEKTAAASALADVAEGRHYPVTSWVECDEAKANMARLAIARDDAAAALDHLSELERRCLETDAGLRRAQRRILNAVAWREACDLDRAVSAMRYALTAAALQYRPAA